MLDGDAKVIPRSSADDARRQLTIVRAIYFGYRQPNGAGTTSAEVPSSQIYAIVELLDHFQDFGPGGNADVRMIINYVRNGHGRNTGSSSHISDRYHGANLSLSGVEPQSSSAVWRFRDEQPKLERSGAPLTGRSARHSDPYAEAIQVQRQRPPRGVGIPLDRSP